MHPLPRHVCEWREDTRQRWSSQWEHHGVVCTTQVVREVHQEAEDVLAIQVGLVTPSEQVSLGSGQEGISIRN